MTTPKLVRVFVNSSAVDILAGSTALDAVRTWNHDAADEVTGDRRVITDSRGLPIDPATTMSAGSILRLIAKRERGSSQESEE